jgi:hypothetical protein
MLRFAQMVGFCSEQRRWIFHARGMTCAASARSKKSKWPDWAYSVEKLDGF